ncbi:MAG: WD40 repeat domain-containing protein [Boseongicola sp. SB0676_bin_33]|nr:WD40 repeat domain-containing protein [Boseongicola sp. SB0676_bin_33]
MSGGVTPDLPRRVNRRDGFPESELEKRGLKLAIGAPVTGAIAAGDAVAVTAGDGTVRFFRPETGPTVTKAHDGAVLCLVAPADHVLTGGDDGRCLHVSPDGQVEEVADFGSRWVDCVAAGHGQRACSSGRTVHVWREGETSATSLEHVSTVGGLAFDPKGRRLAAAHYGGATVWVRGERRWKPSKLVWKGSHGAVSFSPDGKYLVTAMQENALHGWRLRDKGHMAMQGYPAKVKSFAWVGDAPHLATSGADEAICWPFDGKDGPMGRAPLCVAHGGKRLATCVQSLSEENAVFAGFQDGAVLLAALDEAKESIVIRGSTGAEVTAIAATKSLSHVLIGDANGGVLWAKLRAGSTHARTV